MSTETFIQLGWLLIGASLGCVLLAVFAVLHSRRALTKRIEQVDATLSYEEAHQRFILQHREHTREEILRAWAANACLDCFHPECMGVADAAEGLLALKK